MKSIVLASASPRRSELLKLINLDFTVIPSNVDETVDENLRIDEIVEILAYEKAKDIAGRINSDALVIGADTLVIKDRILGKPQNSEQAFQMLKTLQGQWHEVYTGVAVIDAYSGKAIKGYEVTKVKIRQLSDEKILSYIKTGEPMDKAGSYGIQGIGSVIVERIEGCYFNVVGLPLLRLSNIMEEFGVKVL